MVEIISQQKTRRNLLSVQYNSYQVLDYSSCPVRQVYTTEYQQ